MRGGHLSVPAWLQNSDVLAQVGEQLEASLKSSRIELASQHKLNS